MKIKKQEPKQENDYTSLLKPVGTIQTAVEWLYDNLKSHFEHDGDLLEVVQFSFEKAKEMEKEQQDEFAIGFVEWFTSEKSEYSIMYGNQDKRFATFTKAYTTKQLLEQFKNK